jgi:hypothetical protein
MIPNPFSVLYASTKSFISCEPLNSSITATITTAPRVALLCNQPAEGAFVAWSTSVSTLCSIPSLLLHGRLTSMMPHVLMQITCL